MSKREPGAAVERKPSGLIVVLILLVLLDLALLLAALWGFAEWRCGGGYECPL